jgi:hypothetical protein
MILVSGTVTHATILTSARKSLFRCCFVGLAYALASKVDGRVSRSPPLDFRLQYQSFQEGFKAA